MDGFQHSSLKSYRTYGVVWFQVGSGSYIQQIRVRIQDYET